MGRFVFDTNVLVSALLFKKSIPGRGLRAALDRGSILISSATVIELSDVLSRPKFDKYVVAEEREAFIRALVQTAELVDITTSLSASRDPKDNKFLELA